MAIDYKKELETVARRMILVHDPDLLIRMIVRTIVQKVKVAHASILLNHKEKNIYTVTVSRGSLKSKIPVELVHIDKENPLVIFFKENKDKLLFNDRVVVYGEVKKNLRKGNINIDLKRLLEQVLYQMDIFDTTLAIPINFREELLGVLLLGSKNSGLKFNRQELDFFIALASNLAMAIRNTQLFKELESELEKKHQLFIRTTIALAAAIEAKDNYTHGHTTRVANLSLEIAKKIGSPNKKSLDEKFLESLHFASLLHDIGKIGIPEYILNKRGELTLGEKNKIKEHPLIGVAILKPIKELQDTLLGVKYHHERYDGLGYPEGLKGEQIPLIASIIAVADSFDAMITERPYRPALDRLQAVSEIKRLRCRQFNPQVTDAFIELYNEGKT